MVIGLVNAVCRCSTHMSTFSFSCTNSVLCAWTSLDRGLKEKEMIWRLYEQGTESLLSQRAASGCICCSVE